MTRHALEDVEVARLVMRFARDGSRLVGVPHHNVRVRTDRYTALTRREQPQNCAKLKTLT